MISKTNLCTFILSSVTMLSTALFSIAIAQEQTHDMLHATHSIVSEESEASFSIDEILLGNDKTVVGTTSMVEGDISFDLANPQAAQLGTIMIDARDLTTDDRRRNGAIQNRILNTSTAGNEFISFAATTIEGMPEAVAVGDSIEVSITGDLTISGVTLERTFLTQLSIVSETELSGSATTTILHKDFGLSIPKVPVVARVNEDLTLSFNFVARANPPAPAESAESTESSLPTCPATILIENFAFSPAACQVKVGTSITFKNVDGAPHTATSLSGEAIQFDTGRLAGGAEGSITFDTVGSIAYRCDVHPSMLASITVVQ